MKKEILGTKAPKKECTDQKCPFHGTLAVKKKALTGVVVSAKMHNSAIIRIDRRVFIPKYERYINKESKIPVHNPECIDAQEGDIVKVHQTRPISKTKNFVIIEIVGKEKQIEPVEAEE